MLGRRSRTSSGGCVAQGRPKTEAMEINDIAYPQEEGVRMRIGDTPCRQNNKYSKGEARAKAKERERKAHAHGKELARLGSTQEAGARRKSVAAGA